MQIQLNEASDLEEFAQNEEYKIILEELRQKMKEWRPSGSSSPFYFQNNVCSVFIPRIDFSLS